MPDQPASMSRLAGWGAIAVLAAYCLFIGGGWAGTYDGDIRRLTLILAGVGIASWLVLAARAPFWRPRSALAPGFAVALVALAISSMTSQMPRLGLEYLAWSVLLTALYLLLQRLMASPFFNARMMAFATTAAFVVGIAFVVLVLLKWATWWGMIGYLTAPPLRPSFTSLTFGNPSAVMTVTVLLAASAVAWLSGRSRRRTALALGLVILTLLVTLLSGSRAGWIGLALACLLTAGLWLLKADHRTSLIGLTRSRHKRLLILPALVGAITLAAVAAPGIMFRASAGGDALRTAFNTASVRMFESSPLVGLGPGTWAVLRPTYTIEGEPDYYIPHGHNLYLQTVAELGILGVAAGLVMAGLLGRLLYGAVRDADAVRRRVGWCTILATLYFAGHQVLDFYANAPAILFAFAIPIAWLDATSREDRRAATPASRTLAPIYLYAARRSVVVGGLAAILASIGFLGWAETGAAAMQTGTNRLDAGRASESLPDLYRAVGFDPAMPPYHFALGLALAEVGELRAAEAEFLTSATIDDLPEAWLGLAAVRARLDDVPGSRDALARAMRLGSQQIGVVLGVGVTELQLGDRNAAIAAFVQALALGPSLAGDSWWTRDPLRASIWPTVYATAVREASPSSQFELALETGNTIEAGAAIEKVADSDYQETARAILAAWSGDTTAVAILEARARERPLDASIVNWLVRIHGRLGDPVGATKYRAWSDILYVGQGIGADELRVADGQIGGTIAGVSTLYYGHYSYRRPTPLDQFVPWLPDLVAL